MLDEYIKDLIANNNRVIIPNFGAFLLRATSKNKNKKDLASKVEDIYFSPFLKFNDELLVNHIIKNENVDQKTAMDKINEYVKQIEEKVKKDDSYKIEGLGVFSQDEQGKIQFNIAGERTEETKKTTPPPSKDKSAEKKTEEAPKSKTVNQKAAETQKTTASAKGQKEEPKKEAEQKAKTSTTQARPKPEGRKAPTYQKPSYGKKTTKKSASNKGLILSIAIGVPVAVIFIWAMLNFDSVEGIFKKNKNDKQKTEQVAGKDVKKQTQKQETKEPSEKDTKKQESEKQTTKAQQTTKTEKTAVQPTQGKKFYIVAGSFKNKQNAINFKNKLTEEGYNSELIGERNGMHAVSYASFQSKNKANEELKKLREKGIKAWLLYH